MQFNEGTVAGWVVSSDFTQLEHQSVHICKHLVRGRILKILQRFLKTDQLLEKMLELWVASRQSSLLEGRQLGRFTNSFEVILAFL